MNPEMTKMGIKYIKFEELLRKSGIICLHCPMEPQTHHIINKNNIKLSKKGATLINASRGALKEPHALLEAIEKGYLGSLTMHVYEDEKDLYFRNVKFHC